MQYYKNHKRKNSTAAWCWRIKWNLGSPQYPGRIGSFWALTPVWKRHWPYEDHSSQRENCPQQQWTARLYWASCWRTQSDSFAEADPGTELLAPSEIRCLCTDARRRRSSVHKLTALPFIKLSHQDANNFGMSLPFQVNLKTREFNLSLLLQSWNLQIAKVGTGSLCWFPSLHPYVT